MMEKRSTPGEQLELVPLKSDAKTIHHYHHTQCISLIENYGQGLGREERRQLIPIKESTIKESHHSRKASMSPHQNLKHVRVNGFGGDAYYTLEFLAYLQIYAIALQKIVISTCNGVMYGDHYADLPLNLNDDEA